MSKLNRIGKSFVLALALVATTLAGTVGIANAAPTQQAIAANVVVDMSSVGTFDQTPGQSWIWLYRVADHGMYTGTVDTALKSGIDIGKPGNHELAVNGNLFHGSVDAGDFLVVAHLGPKTLVMNKIETIADGNQYPNQTHVMTWSGSGTTGTTTGKKSGGTAAKAKPSAPTGTAMCKLGATNDITTTQTATVVVGATGDVFTGKLLFIQSTVKMLTAESALAAFAKDPKIGVERNLDGMPAGTKVTVNSGNLRVFRLPLTGNAKPVYLGDVDATPNSTHTKLTRVTGVCEPFKLVDGATPTTGTAQNIAAILMLIGGLVVAAVAIGGKFKLIPLSLPQRG